MKGKNKKYVNSLNNNVDTNNLPQPQHPYHQATEFQLICPMPPNMIAVNATEYTNLKNENIELKTKIAEFIKHKDDLMELITQKDRTIDELKKENAELKIKLEHLENEVKNVKEENIIIKQKHNDLEVKHNELKEKHNNLENNFNKMIYKQIFDKYMIAIQDLNKLEQLESKLDQQTQNRLYQLKSNRIYECHYFDNLDSQNLIDDKRTILLEKIDNMPNEIKIIFNKRFPNLLNKITPYIIKTKTTPSQQTIDDINDWWDY
ncbi:hypothetical protein BMW23_0696 [Bodo saltans virus]|uniref:Uncharacterized protein n=1 Tax=Bodo saltans virus TaxID=2024608 RepID=A0A2H4UUZ0_9VIRU|nr:hypothetical protein QJ851_gp0679 [Bodo saltans virus]ATZ80742.1 hypothetical protein BMW23_0696 [Bodo saltans virus]